MGYKESYLSAFEENIHREGAPELLAWMQTTDFFTAPASTRFHGACEAGLVMHSLNVYNVLRERFSDAVQNPESLAICGLLHDLCKANFYKPGFRNVKDDETGVWNKVPSYSVQDAFPYGHGEKSVYLIERFVRLKPVEAVAIRWHMGGFDDAVRGGSYAISDAWRNYPLAVMLHIADLEATYLLEKGTSAVGKQT
ncbi:HD domain-containing protein [Ruminococcaceae bacterium OttesenSCG-928-I18]|nr:HD domain-containing protein [Ruminococcaceae bacterium OttesenSCG-928-I18]